FEAGILRVKPGDKLGFGFGKIERNTVGFRDGRNEEAKEPQNLREDVPAKKSPLRVMRLRVDNLAQVEAAGHQKHADGGHGQREFIADHLGGAAKPAEERILAVRRPAGESDAVDPESGNGEEREYPHVQIGDAEIDVTAE